MNSKNEDFDMFDPTGVWKNMRNQNLETWSKAMVDFVNTDAYADATGKMLDTWLSSSTPFRKLMETAMTQSLANLNLPSRDEITRLAERMTNIEMRLDDMDAKLDEIQAAIRSSSSS